MGLYTATDSHTIHFHQLQRGTSDRIRNRRVNERTGDEVELDDIVKGYDTGEEYVLVEPKELDELAPGRSPSLDIAGFVDLAEVDPIFFDMTYYLGRRGAEYGKVYSLLEQALAKASKAGIATFAMRQHEYLVALKAENGLLTLHTPHWADEIRDPEKEIDSLPGRAKASDKELQMAEQLIDALSMKWDPEQFHDTFQEKVAAMIEAKRSGETVEKAEPARSRPAWSTSWRPCAPASSVRAAQRPPAARPPPPARPRLRRSPGRRSGSAPRRRKTSAPVEGRPLQEGSRRRHPRPLAHEPRGPRESAVLIPDVSAKGRLDRPHGPAPC
ncbi:Ku protein [Streptomyces sp. MB09-01]|uniref:non-homologous end joining protein Ku n=1 Tax=Streptomyces sp. MB09-01 TaxID=3028666 RepID=UPI0029A5DC75|nr:Ku protein [Streptomyces sp. MB09-01]MDX3538591.1 Ku protein [Streptomyces sp. MB09-01]